MPDPQNPPNPPVYLLPLTGRRSGHNKQPIGEAIVEDDPFTRNVLAKMTWHLTRQGYPATNIRGQDGRNRVVKLHRMIDEHYHGPLPPGHEVDHRDRCKLNNLESNLRAVTRSVNSANKGLTRKNTSGHVGVYWDQKRNCWYAKITKNGTPIYLGSFTDPAEAARRVNLAYRKHFPGVEFPNPQVEMYAVRRGEAA